VKFAEALKKGGHDVELHLVEGVGHSDFILHLMNDRSTQHPEMMDHLVSLLLRPAGHQS
jgi:dipeptidyl aminopeptidase/acylaminoacyl peptidase